MPGQLLYVRSTAKPQAPSRRADVLLGAVPFGSACAWAAGQAAGEQWQQRPRLMGLTTRPASHDAWWRRRRLPPRQPPARGREPGSTCRPVACPGTPAPSWPSGRSQTGLTGPLAATHSECGIAGGVGCCPLAQGLGLGCLGCSRVQGRSSEAEREQRPLEPPWHCCSAMQAVIRCRGSSQARQRDEQNAGGAAPPRAFPPGVAHEQAQPAAVFLCLSATVSSMQACLRPCRALGRATPAPDRRCSGQSQDYRSGAHVSVRSAQRLDEE